jgi:hydrogenase maturation protease
MKTILAIGSAFGADRIGWQIAEHFQHHGIENVHTCRHPIDLLPFFSENSDCIIIDALWSSGKPGDVLEIHPADLKKDHCRNSHGLTLFEVIQLASISEQLPEHLTIYGIEINQHSAQAFTDNEVTQIVNKLEQRLDLSTTITNADKG